MDATSLRLISGLLLFAYTASHFSKSFCSIIFLFFFFSLHAYAQCDTNFCETAPPVSGFGENLSRSLCRYFDTVLKEILNRARGGFKREI